MIRLRVHGVPMPQGSKTAFVRGNRAILTDGRSAKARTAHAAWRQAVATAARDHLDAGGAYFGDHDPLAVTIGFLLPKPKSKPKRQLWVTTRPDVDKLARSTLDGLADGGLVADDARVALLTVSKRYAIDEPPGCVVTISDVADAVVEPPAVQVGDHGSATPQDTLV